MKDSQNYFNKNEIDLVDIIAVLLKRKWIIIIPTIIAFILSSVYLSFRAYNLHKIKDIEINVVIIPPQLYKIGENRLLISSYPQLDDFVDKIENELYIKSSSASEGKNVQHFTFNANIIKDNTQRKTLGINVSGKQINIIREEEKISINIQIAGQMEKITEALKSIPQLLNDFQNEANEKNQKIFVQNQEALQNIILHKRNMFNTMMSFLEGKPISKIPPGSEDTILDSLITLDNAITDLENTKELNKSIQLMKGNFTVVTETGIRIDSNNLANIASYIAPVKSIKGQLMLVIVCVLLAFFIGILLTFLIEFFSREDVKRRLREVKNK